MLCFATSVVGIMLSLFLGSFAPDGTYRFTRGIFSASSLSILLLQVSLFTCGISFGCGVEGAIGEILNLDGSGVEGVEVDIDGGKDVAVVVVVVENEFEDIDEIEGVDICELKESVEEGRGCVSEERLCLCLVDV